MAVPGMNTPDAAVSFAEDTSGLYPGLCDRFVASAYGVNVDANGTPHSGYKNAWTHWNQTPQKMRNPGKGKPPIGSLVYWNNTVGGGHGHVAIVTGVDSKGNAIVTSTHANGGKPTEFPLASVMPGAYLGWATPYFQGKTAKLDKTQLAKAVVETGSDPEGSTTGSSTDLTQDKLTKRGLADANSISWDFVKSHPEVLNVFQRAVDEGWNDGSDVGKRKFLNAINKTSWMTENSGYAREYLYAKSKGGEAWAEQVRTAEEQVRLAAQNIGAKMTPEKSKFFAEQMMMNGWNQPGRESFLNRALAGDLSYTDSVGKAHHFQQDFIDYDSGAVAATIQKLKVVAQKNGVVFSDDWYKTAAKSVASTLGSIDDFIAEIRKTAATSNPLWKDKIEAGFDAEDLASPYKARIAQMLDRDVNTIGLDDPLLKQAFGQVDDKGNPTGMGLWDFDKLLKRQPAWANTKAAHEEVSSLTARIVSMFGFGG